MYSTIRPLLVLLLAGLAAAAGAGVASAHAGLVSVDPADGSTGAPTRAVLVFTDPLQPEFVTVTLTDADGTQISLAAPEVLDTTVTQPLPALPAGPVTLAYRVLSEDGHRVEGSTGYTVTSGASSAPAPQLTGAATVTPPPPTTTSALVQPAAADDTAGSPPPWLVAVPVAILVVGAAAAATVVMRGRRTR